MRHLICSNSVSLIYTGIHRHPHVETFRNHTDKDNFAFLEQVMSNLMSIFVFVKKQASRDIIVKSVK